MSAAIQRMVAVGCLQLVYLQAVVTKATNEFVPLVAEEGQGGRSGRRGCSSSLVEHVSSRDGVTGGDGSRCSDCDRRSKSVRTHVTSEH
jgi:hypothetical protein